LHPEPFLLSYRARANFSAGGGASPLPSGFPAKERRVFFHALQPAGLRGRSFSSDECGSNRHMKHINNSTNVIGAVMVVGGGIAGIQSSLDLADLGYYVYLVEKSASIGGVMAQLDKTFPTNDCAI
jgi:heterodisulfide reductase subunit A